MTRKCIVLKCNSGHESNKEQVSLFHVPKDEELKMKWIDVIPNTSVAGKFIMKVLYKWAGLVGGAIPSIFSDVEGCPNIIHSGEVHDDIECREPEQYFIMCDTTTPNSDPDGNASKSMIVDNQTVEITHDYQTENGSGALIDETKEPPDNKSNQSLKDILEETYENPDSLEIPKSKT